MSTAHFQLASETQNHEAQHSLHGPVKLIILLPLPAAALASASAFATACSAAFTEALAFAVAAYLAAGLETPAVADADALAPACEGV